MSTILPRNPLPTVGFAIKSAADYLAGFDLGYGHGTCTPEDDAAWLVLESAGLSPVDPPDYEMGISFDAVELCEKLLVRRATERIPVAYLVGRTWFAGLEFLVDERALIPRSPVAELIAHDFHDLVDTSAPFSVLDLCTGGGCIGVAIAQLMPEAQVIATDISADALALATQNRDKFGLSDRVSLVQGDLFDSVRQDFDLIISNPPYVDARDISCMDPEFLHEPEIGLASGEDGLDLTRRILENASNYLKPGGVLIVEVGNSAEALENAFPELPFLWFEFSAGGSGVFALTCDELMMSGSA